VSSQELQRSGWTPDELEVATRRGGQTIGRPGSVPGPAQVAQAASGVTAQPLEGLQQSLTEVVGGGRASQPEVEGNCVVDIVSPPSTGVVRGRSGSLRREDCVTRHPLTLRSAYAAVLGSEPAWTSCHCKYQGTLDYVFYEATSSTAGQREVPRTLSGGRLQPVQVLWPPEAPHTGLPSWQVPSDHVSLVVRFSLRH